MTSGSLQTSKAVFRMLRKLMQRMPNTTRMPRTGRPLGDLLLCPPPLRVFKELLTVSGVSDWANEVSTNAPFLSVPMTLSAAMSNFGGRWYHHFTVMQFWCPHGLQGWVCELSMDAPFMTIQWHHRQLRPLRRPEILLFLSTSIFSYSWQLLSSMASVFMSCGLQLCRQNRPLSSQLYTIGAISVFSQICKNMRSIN